MKAQNPEDRGRYSIAGLAHMSRTELAKLWEEILSTSLPKGLSRPMLLKILAWELQAKCHGGLKPGTRRKLAKALAGEQGAASQARAARPGSRLVREWNGETHIVETLGSGFRWQGRDYKSLSAIARDITGTKWSGPRFFGLTERSAP